MLGCRPSVFPFKLVAPDTFNDDKNVKSLETDKLLKLVLLLVSVENVENIAIST
jgi:hypothetical protein